MHQVCMFSQSSRFRMIYRIGLTAEEGTEGLGRGSGGGGGGGGGGGAGVQGATLVAK